MSDELLYDRYGWQSDLPTFSSTEARVVRARLANFVADAAANKSGPGINPYRWLQRECSELAIRDTNARNYTAILEYELPRDFRRPDVVVLEHGVIVVLELKGRPNVTQAALDQVAAYARDLKSYHAACSDKQVVPVLLTSARDVPRTKTDGVFVLSHAALDGLLAELSNPPSPL